MGLGINEILVILFVLVLSLIALIDILKSNFRESVNKVIWTLVVVLIPIFGAILYFIIGRSQKRIE